MSMRAMYIIDDRDNDRRVFYQPKDADIDEVKDVVSSYMRVLDLESIDMGLREVEEDFCPLEDMDFFVYIIHGENGMEIIVQEDGEKEIHYSATWDHYNDKLVLEVR